MLAKEYGHKSPWVGIGAYSVATGLMRMANNKHWLSDVLAGAGIGILSTELGYFLADLIFKEKGISTIDASGSFDRMYKPSFLGLYIGINIPLNGYRPPLGQHRLRTSPGSTAGIEGAWFFNRHIGLGGRFTVAGTSVNTGAGKAESREWINMLAAGSSFMVSF